MTDRPILFSAPMVRALLDGRKTQTRRTLYSVRKADTNGELPPSRYFKEYLPPNLGLNQIATLGTAHLIQPGDRLWVKETWRTSKVLDHLKPTELDDNRIWYEADRDNCDQHGKTRVSLFMRRWMSRLTLLVTDVRIERLNDCTDEDALAEGVVEDTDGRGFMVPGIEHPNKDFPYLSRSTARGMYAALWDTINGSGEWLGNPWVVAISFEVQQRNIDV